MSEIPFPVDSITGLDILKMLNAPTEYPQFLSFRNSQRFVNNNPAFRGFGKYDEHQRLIDISKRPNNPRLQIGNWFLILISQKYPSPKPLLPSHLFMYQVYEHESGVIKNRYIRFGSFNYANPENFEAFKNNKFNLTDFVMATNSGGWAKKTMHYQIWDNSSPFINWPFEKPKGLI